MPKPIENNRNEQSIRDAAATQEMRGAVEAQIFDSRVFKTEDHGIRPRPVNEEEDDAKWGYHPVNNSLDIINPFAVVTDHKYVFRSWAELRESAITDQEKDLEIQITANLLLIATNVDMAVPKEARRKLLASLEDVRSTQKDAVNISFPLSPETPVLRPVNDPRNDAVFTKEERKAFTEFTRNLINALIIRRVVRRVRICGSWTNTSPNGMTDMALIFIGQSHYLPPNPQVFVIPRAGHTIYPEAWRAQRLVSLTRRPFNECVRAQPPSKFDRPILIKPLVDQPNQ